MIFQGDPPRGGGGYPANGGGRGTPFHAGASGHGIFLFGLNGRGCGDHPHGGAGVCGARARGHGDGCAGREKGSPGKAPESGRHLSGWG